MEIYSKQKKIQVNYRPLQTSGKIEVVGSVPSVHRGSGQCAIGAGVSG